MQYVLIPASPCSQLTQAEHDHIQEAFARIGDLPKGIAHDALITVTLHKDYAAWLAELVKDYRYEGAALMTHLHAAKSALAQALNYRCDLHRQIDGCIKQIEGSRAELAEM